MDYSPAGRQWRLRVGEQELCAVEVGGGLRSYRVGDRDILDGYGPDALADGGRGQILAPWPNRLARGRYDFDGRSHQLPLNEVDQLNAIHGLVRWSAWELASEEANEIRLVHRLHPQPGWAWTLDLAVTYRLDESGLTVSTVVHNASPERCPFGLGWHPYVAAFGGLVDDTVLTVPARWAYRTDGRGIPVARYEVDGSDRDYRAGRRIGDARMDTCFTGLDRDTDGRATVTVSAGGGPGAVRVWMAEPFSHVMVYSGDTLADEARRRRGLAVEPMTGPPNLLASGENRLVLDAGASLELIWGIAATEQPASSRP